LITHQTHTMTTNLIYARNKGSKWITNIAIVWMLLQIMACASSKPTPTGQATFDAIDQMSYQFTPNNMQPLGTRQININGNYFIRLHQKRIDVDLPYVGRANQATPGTTEQGMLFTSTQFDHDVRAGKKGGKEITIKPRDVSQISSLIITAYNNGTASVQINSTNRAAISYNGNIEAYKPK
jgi:hypothetical protein